METIITATGSHINRYTLSHQGDGIWHIYDNLERDWLDFAGNIDEAQSKVESLFKPKSKRGGYRPRAGRPFLEPHQEAGRAVTKSITLPAHVWGQISDHASGTLSQAIAALMQLHGQPNGTHAEGWSEMSRSSYELHFGGNGISFNDFIKRATRKNV